MDMRFDIRGSTQIAILVDKIPCPYRSCSALFFFPSVISSSLGSSEPASKMKENNTKPRKDRRCLMRAGPAGVPDGAADISLHLLSRTEVRPRGLMTIAKFSAVTLFLRRNYGI